MTFLSPKSLDLERLILKKTEHVVQRRITKNGQRIFQKSAIKSKHLLKHLPYCYYLIDLIIKRSKEAKDLAETFGYINLKTDLLNKVIPNHTRIMVTSLLEQLDVIKINHKYSPNDFSKSYKINSKYDLNELIFIDYSLNQKGHNIGEEYNILKEDIKDRESLCCVLFDKSQKVEKKKVRQLNEKTTDLLKLPEYSFQQKCLFDLRLDYNSIERDGKSQDLNQLIEKVNSGDGLGININNSVNRVFSPITNLKRDYRKYIVDGDGNSLVEIDFKSSHIFHLLKLVMGSNPTNELVVEANKLRDIALVGIYEYVSQEGEKAGYSLNREQAKQLFIESFLYGMYPNRRLSRWVKSLFPFISEFLDKRDRKNRSIDIQKSESLLLNNRIFKRIASDLAKSHCFGIFDSILVNRENAEGVEQIMKEEAAKYFGYEVPITFKSTHPKQANMEMASLNIDFKNFRANGHCEKIRR